MTTSTLPTTTAVHGVLDAVADLVTAVREGAVAGAQAPQLAADLAAVRAAQASLEWVSLQVVREVDVSGAHVTDGAMTPAAWLRQQTRMGHSDASLAVRTARALGDVALAPVSEALAAGEIGAAHARVIAGAAADAPPGAVETILPHALAAARAADPACVARIMRRFTEALDPDKGDEDAVRRYERRGVSAATTLDGMVAGRFLLDPVAGSALLTALDAAAPRAARDPRTSAQRRADGLGTVAEHFLGSADLPRTGGARPHVVLTDLTPAASPDPSGAPGPAVTADALSEALEAALGGEGPRLSWVGPVPPRSAQRVACDSHVTVVSVDPSGEVTGHRSQRRFFTWAQCLAMIARDGDRCPWPWCDRPIRWSHGHHLVPVEEGGPTTVRNGAMPCDGHHVLVHEGRWRLERLPDGRYLARHLPSGRVIGPEPYRRPRGTRPPPLRRE